MDEQIIQQQSQIQLEQDESIKPLQRYQLQQSLQAQTQSTNSIAKMAKFIEDKIDDILTIQAKSINQRNHKGYVRFKQLQQKQPKFQEFYILNQKNHQTINLHTLLTESKQLKKNIKINKNSLRKIKPTINQNSQRHIVYIQNLPVAISQTQLKNLLSVYTKIYKIDYFDRNNAALVFCEQSKQLLALDMKPIFKQHNEKNDGKKIHHESLADLIKCFNFQKVKDSHASFQVSLLYNQYIQKYKQFSNILPKTYRRTNPNIMIQENQIELETNKKHGLPFQDEQMDLQVNSTLRDKYRISIKSKIHDCNELIVSRQQR